MSDNDDSSTRLTGTIAPDTLSVCVRHGPGGSGSIDPGFGQRGTGMSVNVQLRTHVVLRVRNDSQRSVELTCQNETRSRRLCRPGSKRRSGA